MGDQPRWPKGTPVAPGGHGPGGGRFRQGREALAAPPLAPLEGVTIGRFDRGFDQLDERTRAFIEYHGAGAGLISSAAEGTLTHPAWVAEPEVHVQARRYAAAIDEAMRQSQLPHPVELYRGIRAGHLFGPAETWPDDLTGREWTDTRYLSTSANSGIGEPVAILRPRGWQGGRTAMDFVDRATQMGGSDGLAHLTIRVPAGVGAVRLSPWAGDGLAEAEVLLDRGLRYRVVGDHGWETVEGRDGPMRVRMLDIEVLPGDWVEQVLERVAGRRP